MSYNDERPKRDIHVAELAENPPTSTRRSRIITTVGRVLRSVIDKLLPPAETPEQQTVRDTVVSTAADAGSLALDAVVGKWDAASQDGNLKRAEVSRTFNEAAKINEEEQLTREMQSKTRAETEKILTETRIAEQGAALDNLERVTELLIKLGATPTIATLPDGRLVIAIGQGLVGNLPKLPGLVSSEADGAVDFVALTGQVAAVEAKVSGKMLTPIQGDANLTLPMLTSEGSGIVLSGKVAEARAEAFPGSIVMGEPPGGSDEDDEEPDDEQLPPYNQMS